jgi:salicylate hydroxylase
VGHAVGLEVRQQLLVGPGMVFVTYYVSSGRRVNWVGFTPTDGWREESWSARGDRDEALAHFAGWHPEVRALIAGTEAVFKWALFDRQPLETWTRGRVTLLGDAAHPMLPFMGQGAAQSIEDAAVLARCLEAGRDDPERAIGTYADHRRERAAALQAASRDAGRNLQLSDPAAVAARNARMRDSAEVPSAMYDWVWGYDVEDAFTADLSAR